MDRSGFLYFTAQYLTLFRDLDMFSRHVHSLSQQRRMPQIPISIVCAYCSAIQVPEIFRYIGILSYIAGQRDGGGSGSGSKRCLFIICIRVPANLFIHFSLVYKLRNSPLVCLLDCVMGGDDDGARREARYRQILVQLQHTVQYSEDFRLDE